jgi:diguanylate cyclase (GGDEF)-like protein
MITIDHRLAELRLLENLADRTWEMGVSVAPASGQAAELKVSDQIYAEMVMTLLEDGYLYTIDSDIRNGLWHYARYRNPADRDATLNQLQGSSIYRQMSVTYRGLRQIDELRDRLRKDRILEKFGILLDGRYIVSDLIRFLEEADGQPVSLIFADIDDFKRYNTDRGYQAGDLVLCHVFRIVQRAVGRHGDVYRRGGDEIVSILPYSELDASKNLAQRIREEVAASVALYGDEEIRVTLSIGVAASPPCNPDGPALEALAGNASNQAKLSGKNCVIVASCGSTSP